jgi:molybdopterin converting factor subunit 1
VVNICVRLFARARETAGTSSLVLELPEGATTETAIEHLNRSVPAVAAVTAISRFAVNQEYIDGVATLKEGDELAVIPPVSGGIW